MSLNWDREALDNGDGPPTVVAYGPEGNELFYVHKLEDYNQWQPHVTYGPKRWVGSERIEFIFNDRGSAEKICEHLHELAEINHGY